MKRFHSLVRERLAFPLNASLKQESKPTVMRLPNDRISKIRNADVILEVALQQRRMAPVINILKNDFWNISTSILQKALRIGLSEYNLVLLRYVMKHNKFNEVDASFAQDLAIRFAAKHNQLEFLRILLKNPSVSPHALKDEAFRITKSHQIRCFLARDPRVLMERNDETFHLACKHGLLSRVEIFLKDPRIDPGSESNLGLRLAVQHGHAEIVKLLLADSRVDPSDFQNHAIKLACDYNHEYIVKILLQDPRVSPNKILKYPCMNHNLNLLKYLLNDFRLRNRLELHNGLYEACKGDALNIVDHLLKHTHVLPMKGFGSVLVVACKNGHLRIVKRLLDDERYMKANREYDAALDMNMGFKCAVEKGNYHIVDYFLEELGFQPEFKQFTDESEAEMADTTFSVSHHHIFKAIRFGNLKVVNLLLSNYHYDFSIYIQDAIKHAAQYQKEDVLSFLRFKEKELIKELPKANVAQKED